MRYLIVICVLGCFLWSCSSDKNETVILEPTNLSGETLAKMHCGSCHEYVAPNMLDKKTWEHRTLPEMGLRLGIGDVFSKNVLQVQQGTENLVHESIYPLSPKIHEDDYKKIVEFYLKNAPEEPLPQTAKISVKEGLEYFEYKSLMGSYGYQSNTTAIGFDEASKTILAGSPRFMVKQFNLSNNQLLSDSIMMPGVYSTIKKWRDNWYFLDLGQLGPHEKKQGKLIQYLGNGQYQTFLADLHKPTDFAFLDINNDGVEDVVICNFGFETGNLAWYDGKTKKENVIKNIPGARNTVLEDMNNDGLKDIVVLYAQALEGISVFYNQGNGKFKEKELLKFSPVFGSSWFQLIDMNKDGKLDIVYANGDNADYSTTLKNYHGVRIFENQGNDKFRQTYFYPMYGATKAIAADFDNDGDIDIASIAYYRKDAKEGFVYLENDDRNGFKPYTFNEVAKGQWLTLEIGDVDGNGKVDILLGGHDLARRNKAGKEAVEVVVLLNK